MTAVFFFLSLRSFCLLDFRSGTASHRASALKLLISLLRLHKITLLPLKH